MADQCNICKFYRLRTLGTAPDTATVGECRVIEPTPDKGWPRVKVDDWCGKYVLGP